MPSSVRTAQNCHGRHPASTTNVSISVIFTVELLAFAGFRIGLVVAYPRHRQRTIETNGDNDNGAYKWAVTARWGHRAEAEIVMVAEHLISDGAVRGRNQRLRSVDVSPGGRTLDPATKARIAGQRGQDTHGDRAGKRRSSGNRADAVASRRDVRRGCWAGYSIDPEKLLNGALFDVEYDQLVVVKSIRVLQPLRTSSSCRFTVPRTLGYLPQKKVIGLSKIPPHRRHVRAPIAGARADDSRDCQFSSTR